MTREVSSDSLHQGREKIPRVEAAGLPQRKDSFHPSVSLFTRSTLGTFAPKNSKPEHAFGMIVRGGNTRYFQEEPKGIDFPVESQGKLSRSILAVSMKSYESDEAGVEGAPLAYGRRTMCHMAESLKLCQCPVAEAGNLRVFPLRELPGFTDQMSKAALPLSHPFTIDSIAVTYENALPVPDEGFEGFPGTVSMDHEESHRGIGHHPEPLENFLLAERGLINVIDLALSCHFADFIVVGLDSRRDTVNDLLDGAQTYVDSQHRGAELLNGSAAVTLASSHLSDGGAKPWAISCPVFSGKRRFAHLAAARAGSPIEDKVGHFHFDFRELDMLMGVIGTCIREIFVTTDAGLGLQMFGFAGLQHDLPMTFVTLLTSGLS